MSAKVDDHAQVLKLINEGYHLLAGFAQREQHEPEAAWESVVELQQSIERLRQLRPPRPFASYRYKIFTDAAETR